ncbi:hypothetical protein [Methylomicrobium lacus]|uniref:hypothetical protein n=1 Tax=Methylomicrobium lacus TaxID=136992 RepID=UPI00045EB83F|nr:hypothetical protein [Methylomicrobium lacus]
MKAKINGFNSISKKIDSLIYISINSSSILAICNDILIRYQGVDSDVEKNACVQIITNLCNKLKESGLNGEKQIKNVISFFDGKIPHSIAWSYEMNSYRLSRRDPTLIKSDFQLEEEAKAIRDRQLNQKEKRALQNREKMEKLADYDALKMQLTESEEKYSNLVKDYTLLKARYEDLIANNHVRNESEENRG